MSLPRLGLLGAGRIGAMHARIAAPRSSHLVVADAVTERARTVADSLGAETRSPQELLNSDDLEGILIATPTDKHCEHIIEAVKLGIPIFCEKPVALDIASTIKANQAAQLAGVPVHIGFQRHFDTAYSSARSRLADGTIGDLRRIHMHTLDQAPAQREFLAASGGIYTDCLIHDFDALRWVTGLEVEEVFVYGSDLGIADFADFGDVCETVVVMKLQGDVLATAHSSRFNGHGYDVRMELHGTLATDVVGMDEHLPVHSLEPGISYPGGQPWVDFIARFQECYERELDAFIKVIAGTGEVPATIDDAVASLEIAEACKLSYSEHRPVRIDEIRAHK